MAAPKKYQHQRSARFSDETDAWLVKEAARRGIVPAVLIRVLVEQAEAAAKEQSNG